MRSRRPARLIPILLPALLAAAGSHALAQAVAPPAPAPAQPRRERLVPLEVSINTMQAGNWLLMERDGALYAPEEALAEWRIEKPAGAPLEARGTNWYPLAALPGFQARTNQATQSIELVFSPNAFAATQVKDAPQARLPLSPVVPAVFFNLDTSLSLVKPRRLPAARDLGAVGEAGLSGAWGVFTSSFVGRDLLDDDPFVGRAIHRLETAFTRDLPERNVTLRVGDSVTHSGMWGRAVYFGGVQVARNFSLTPGFIAQPVPLVTGSSAAPSTVELYVNDALRQTSQVPTGPFVVQNFPVLSGAGEARVVVRDVLGRETITVQPFFTSALLLAPGVSDWSFEAGAVRRGLGETSNDYGEGLAIGGYKYGLTDETSVEGRFELTRELRNAGLGVTQALFRKVLAQAAYATSQADAGTGREWLAGLSHESLRHGYTLRARGTSLAYTQAGIDTFFARRKREYSATYAYNGEAFGSFGAGVARLESHDGPSIDTFTLSYSRRIGARSSFTVTGTRVFGFSASTAVAASLIVPLDNLLTVGGSVATRSGQVDAYASADQGTSGETGLAWRVLGGVRSDTPFAEAGLRLLAEQAVLSADTAASRDQQAVRLGAQTGMVLVGGKTYFTQRVQDSFALVQVPGYAKVGVGFHGRTHVHTDADGDALVTRLVPYAANNIALNPGDLPINAELDTIELPAVPPARSAVRVAFPVRSGRGALIRIVFDDGQPAPAGAEVELAGDKQEFFVARRGESFVTGLKERNTLRLRWKGASCTFDVALPPGEIDEIARVGPVACQGVRR